MRRWAIWLAVSFWFTFFTSGYMGYMFFVTAAVIGLYMLFRKKLPLDREALRAAAVAVLLTAVLSLPFLSMRSQKSVPLIQPRISRDGRRLLPGEAGYEEAAGMGGQGKWQ